MAEDLITFLSDLKEQDTLRVTEERLNSGEDPLDILNDAKQAMQIVGERFSSGTYFIPDLVYSGKILEKVADMVKPMLKEGPSVEPLGRFVIGTVAGDLHDIGKNLVAFMLEINGFDVFDLGVDVQPQTFVDKIREIEPQVVGLSGFLTSVYKAMKDTLDAIEQAGLRDRVKIIIGGGVMDDDIKDYCGADAYGSDAMAAVHIATQWIGEA